MQPFTALLDAPTDPGKPIQIAQLGDYSDKRYGDFSITEEIVQDWQKNLSALPGGEALIDFEHRSERKPRDSRAAGWITGIELDGDKVMATPRWTPEGETAVRDGAYRFVSPAYGEMTNEHGATFENTLMSLALTNKPALTGLPAVVLASEERVSEAAGEEIVRLLSMALDPDLDSELDMELGDEGRARLMMLSVSAADRKKAKDAGNSLPDGSYPINNIEQLHSAAVLSASKHGNWSAAKQLVRRRAKELGVSLTHLPGMTKSDASESADSRQHEMPDALLIKLLDLPEDADEATILEAASALKAKADAPAPAAKESKKDRVKTLEQQAEEKGLIVLDQKEAKQLRLDAAAGALASRQLHQQAFENAFDKALSDRKVTPGEKDGLQELYDVAPEATLKTLDARQAIMPEKPLSDPTLVFDPEAPENFDHDAAAQAGYNPGSVQLDAQVQKYMREHNRGPAEYAKVLEQVVNGEIQL